LVHLRKVVAIKVEVEKLLKVGFIYPVPLTNWVSNIVPITKNNRACRKDNYPTPFIDQIIDDCVENEIFSFMDRFSKYNQINILPSNQHKFGFICPWETFSYRNLPFGLKNVGETFQRSMSYAFNDIKNIIQPYLDELLAHSKKCQDHIMHLRAIFL